jgi:predicted O-methyltransferase YrrM
VNNAKMESVKGGSVTDVWGNCCGGGGMADYQDMRGVAGDGTWRRARSMEAFVTAIYEELVRLTHERGAAVKYQMYKKEPVANRLQMVGHASPLSIKYPEFEFMRDFIAKNNLKRGYEVATGFGISTLSIGLGMKQTGGKVVTMDAYVEEHYGDGFAYEHKSDETYKDMDGFKSVQFLIEAYGLQEVVFPTVGWSPTDTRARISSVFDLTKEKLDFVFIDGGHWDDFAMNDVKAIRDIMDDRFALFVHDTHMLGEKFHGFIGETFGRRVEQIESCKWPQGCFLGYLASL